jgi:hypothetical protein
LYKQGYLSSVGTAELDLATRQALVAFIGNENFEERADPAAGWIDKPVLDYIYRKFED